MTLKKKKILFLVPYPLKESPSQRFRFEQYFTLLPENGIVFDIQSFLDANNWQLFYRRGKSTSKAFALLQGFFKRMVMLFKAHRYDFIFIHREAAPVGPPLIEWILAKLLGKKIIYDFDDAIWSTDKKDESSLEAMLKCRGKVKAICRWSYRVSCGNAYLVHFAKKYNRNVVLNPTTIDTVHVHNPALFQKYRSGEKVVIGWTGSHSTLKYLNEAENVLLRIERKFPNVEIVIIADQNPKLNLKTLRFVPWSAETEIPDLMSLDIGIMPLPDDIWTKGKCGFKALQYMALRIPAVASPVGVNTAIIEDGKNGFLCSEEDEWESALTRLIVDRKLREQMGDAGRNKVIEAYSVLSNSSTFLALFA